MMLIMPIFGNTTISAIKALGAELPRYKMLGTGIRVYFPALESAFIGRPETPNCQSGGIDGGLAERILASIRSNAFIIVQEMSETLEVLKRMLEREMKKLRSSGRIIRVGGNRYGHWKIND